MSATILHADADSFFASVVEAVHELLTPAEAVDVVLDGARRSAGKIAVALTA